MQEISKISATHKGGCGYPSPSPSPSKVNVCLFSIGNIASRVFGHKLAIRGVTSNLGILVLDFKFFSFSNILLIIVKLKKYLSFSLFYVIR